MATEQRIRSMPDDISEQEFLLFRQFMLSASGVDLGMNKHALVQSRLAKRLIKLGMHNYAQYWRVMNQTESYAERQFVINALSTNETYFFREPEHFKWLSERAQQHQKQTDRPFRVWSAACSSGEEAYSISMALSEVFEDKQQFYILATDINTEVLSFAKRGIYPNTRLNMVPPNNLRKYMLWGRDEFRDCLLVAPEIKQQVQFRQANLLQSSLEKSEAFDVIFLRNVMIYFNEETKLHVLREIGRKLRDDGVLLTSHSESLSGIDCNLSMLRPSYYQKTLYET